VRRLQQSPSLAAIFLVLFGSVARGEEFLDIDLDIIVEFDRPSELFEFKLWNN
jgi:predicted nucleotidyltransferase